MRRKMRSSIIRNRGYRMMSSMASPWLILPTPEYDDTTKLYSLAEKKVVSIKKKEAALAPGWQVMHMGCTRGWLASFIDDNPPQPFLSDPITGRHIRLPIAPVPSPHSVPSKIILTSSPDARDCRAIMTTYDDLRVGLCFPGRSTSWLPVCDKRERLDLAYSTRHRRLFCLTTPEFLLQCWDLESPSFLWQVPLFGEDSEEEEEVVAVEEKELESDGIFLAMDEHSDRLFLVLRGDCRHVGLDGSYMKAVSGRRGLNHREQYPKITLGFDVYEIDVDKGTPRYMDGSLDGLAIFVEGNHSFALPAADLNLSPDSIYFVDQSFHDHNIGVFNYVDTKVSSVYYPSHTSQISMIERVFLFTPMH